MRSRSSRSLHGDRGRAGSRGGGGSTARRSGGSPHRRRGGSCLDVHHRRAARGVLAVLRGTRKATASHGSCRDGNRVHAEPRGSSRDGSVKSLFARFRRATVSGSISTGGHTSTSPAISRRSKPRVSSPRSSRVWRRTSSSTSATAARSIGGCSAPTTALPKGSAPSRNHCVAEGVSSDPCGAIRCADR